MFLSRAFFYTMILFGLGCAVSNSLMSTGFHLIALWVLMDLVKSRGSCRNFLQKQSSLLAGLLYFLAISLSSFVQVEDSTTTLLNGNLVLFWVFAFASLSTELGEKKVKKIEAALVLSYAFLFFYVLYHFIWGTKSRAHGFHGNPNYFAGSLLPAIVYFSKRSFDSLSPTQKRTSKIFQRVGWPLYLYFFSLLFVLLSYSMTKTRSVFLAVLFLFFYWAFRTLRSKWVAKRYVFGFALFLLLMGYFSGILRRFQWDKVVSDHAILSRIEIWKINWEMFSQSPILGTGYMKNRIDAADYPELSTLLNPRFQDLLAHNDLIQILAESGLLGFSCFAFFIGLACIKRPEFRLYLLCFLIAGMGDTLLHMTRALPALTFFLLLEGFRTKIDKKERK